jgi:hypothetical protein
MTIITYKDGVMASDTGARNESVIRTNVTKIFKCPSGALYGFAGNADSMSDYISWVKHGGVDEKPPIIPGNKDTNVGSFIVLRVSADGQFKKLITSFGSENYSDEPYCAIGAAQEVAYGAFWMGASATKAVEACLAHSPYAFGIVDAIKLTGR